MPALGHALAGSTGAAISNVCTYPLSLIITRLQIQRQLRRDAVSSHSEEYKSIQDAAQKIYNGEGGLSAFYAGLVSDTSKTIADSFLFFLAYNFLRQSRIRSSSSSSKHLPVIDELSVGFLAGALSKFLTTPIANIVTRKQTSSMLSKRSSNTEPEQTSVRSIALRIRDEKGLRGFWSGYSASLILTLNPSLTFFFFEALKRSLLPRNKRSGPSPQATFFLAAMSKAMASTITYPFSLAKSRLQASTSNSQEKNTTSVKLEPESARKAPRNVFTTILHIIRTEGLEGLYEGLGGEVLKGFFSHGITMIVKDAAHKLVVQLYYATLKLLRRYPSPQELAEAAKEQAGQMADDVATTTQDAAVHVSSQTIQVVESVGEHAKQAVVTTTTDVKTIFEESVGLVNEVVNETDDDT